MIKKITSLFLLLQLLFVTPSFASPQAGLDLAVVAINNKNWLGAKKLLEPLYDKNSNDNYVNNLLAVVYFNIGKLDAAQELLVSVIESHQDSKYAYKNLEKLFSYSAAKTYSKGLNLQSPVEMPEMLIAKNSQPIIATESDNRGVADTLSENKEIEKPVKENKEAVADKYINRTSFWQEQLQETLTDNKSKPVESTSPPNDNAISQKNSEKQSIEVKTKESHTKENSENLIKSLTKRLFLWQKLWVKGNTQQYIAMYSDNYSPNDKSRQQWIKSRKKNVTAEKNIQVDILNEKIQLVTEQLAVITFDQYYQSTNYQDKVRKRLYWKKINGEWNIYREVVLGTL